MATVIEFSQLGKTLNKFGKQFEFAIVLALTRTAVDGKVAVQKELAKEFELRSTWSERGIRIKPATKSDPVAEVFSKDWYLRQQETGDKREKPDDGFLEVPVNIRKALGKTNSQRVPKVKTIMNMSFGADQAKPFVINHNKSKGGRHPGKFKFTGVYVRTSSKRYELSLLFVLKADQKIKRREFFQDTVDKIYDKNFAKNLQKAEEEAFRTAFK